MLKFPRQHSQPSQPEQLAESMVPIAHSTIDIPGRDFAAEGLLRSTDQRIQRRRHVTATPLTVSSGVGVFGNAHKGSFIDTRVARAWVTTCRTT